MKKLFIEDLKELKKIAETKDLNKINIAIQKFINGYDYDKIPKGAKIKHPKFGLGVVDDINSSINITTLDIKFEKVGRKFLIAEHADIKIDN
jgi:hypothetical protein